MSRNPPNKKVIEVAVYQKIKLRTKNGIMINLNTNIVLLCQLLVNVSFLFFRTVTIALIILTAPKATVINKSKIMILGSAFIKRISIKINKTSNM